MLADLRDELLRNVQALVRDKPFVALGGAAAAGYVIGGGWRSRVGRAIVLAAAKYVVVKAAERYFSA
jgi:hypothetical protein